MTPPPPFDWSEFLNLAKQIAEDSALTCTKEAKLRCAISRAYYAVFHKASAVVLPNRKVAGFNSHQEIIDTLQGSNDAEHRRLGVNFQRLKGHRVKADYSDAVGNLTALTHDTLLSAEELIDGLNSL